MRTIAIPLGITMILSALVGFLTTKFIIWSNAQPKTYEVKKPLKPEIIINHTTQDTTYVYTIEKI